MSFDINLHPIFVHFPIALFVSALGLEAASILWRKESLHQTAFHLYVLAACLAPFTVLTGWREAEELHLQHRILDIHRSFALLTMGGSLFSLPFLWFIQKKTPQAFRITFLLCLILIVGFITVTAYNGGRMVFEYGIGIEK